MPKSSTKGAFLKKWFKTKGRVKEIEINSSAEDVSETTREVTKADKKVSRREVRNKTKEDENKNIHHLNNNNSNVTSRNVEYVQLFRSNHSHSSRQDTVNLQCQIEEDKTKNNADYPDRTECATRSSIDTGRGLLTWGSLHTRSGDFSGFDTRDFNSDRDSRIPLHSENITSVSVSSSGDERSDSNSTSRSRFFHHRKEQHSISIGDSTARDSRTRHANGRSSLFSSATGISETWNSSATFSAIDNTRTDTDCEREHFEVNPQSASRIEHDQNIDSPSSSHRTNVRARESEPDAHPSRSTTSHNRSRDSSSREQRDSDESFRDRRRQLFRRSISLRRSLFRKSHEKEVALLEGSCVVAPEGAVVLQLFSRTSCSTAAEDSGIEDSDTETSHTTMVRQHFSISTFSGKSRRRLVPR